MDQSISLKCFKQNQTRTFEFKHVDCEVIDIQATTTTTLSDTRSYLDGGGMPTGVLNTMKGHTIKVQTVFVRTTTGKEIDFRLANEPIALRVGNKVSLVFLEDQDGGGKVLVGVVNHNSEKAASLGEFNETGYSILLHSMDVKPKNSWPNAIIACALIGGGIIWGMQEGIGMSVLGALGGVVACGPALWISKLITDQPLRSACKRAEELRRQLIKQVLNREFSGAPSSS